MLSWNYFAYFLTILFFIVQQLGLDYYAFQLNQLWILIILLLIDLGVFFFFLFNHDVDFAATRGGNCWVVYTWATTIKLVIMYFTKLSKILQEEGVLIQRVRGGVTEVEILLLIAPILYALLSFRGYDELFGGVMTISTESMLHGDLILHVILDWWDIVAAFSTFIYFPPMMQKDCHWLRITVGVVISVAVFLHAYSFATLGDASGQQGKEKTKDEGGLSCSGEMAAVLRDAGDVFVTRKLAALVGICVVDVPLCVFRIYLWVSYPTFVGFSPFIVKNVTSIMMQGMRMWQVISAAKLKSHAVKGREKRKSLLEKHAEDGFIEPTPDPRKVVKFAADTVADAPSDRLTRARISSSFMFGSSHALPGGGLWDVDSDRCSDITMVGDDEQAREEEQQLKELVVKMLATKAPRSLPVDPIRHRQLIRKIVYCMRMGGRHSLGVSLDNVLHISFWKLFRLAFPFMLMWLCQLAVVAILQFLEPVQGNPTGTDLIKGPPSNAAKLEAFPIQLFDTRVLSQVFISDIPNDVSICLYINCALLVLSLCLWIFSVPFLDVLCISLFTAIQLFSFFLVVLTFRDFRIFYDMFGIASDFDNPDVGRYFVWLFVLEPAVGMLFTLYPFLCVLMDKQYLGYVVPLPNAATVISKVSKIASSFSVGRGSLHGTRGKNWAGGQEGEFGDNQPKRGDELGLMTISSLIVFLNCRFCVAPISLHELLIGPDLIKSSRLMEGLLYSHFRYLCIASVARLWCASLYRSFPVSLTYGADAQYQKFIQDNLVAPNVGNHFRFNVALMTFVTHLVGLFVYLVFTQVVRLITLRRYETKAMFEEIYEAVRQHQGKEKETEEGGGASPLEAELEWITEKYKTHGFYTTPGDILPSFF